MRKLFARSFIVLALLFGLLFAVGVAVVYYLGLTIWYALGLAVLILVLQYLLGPVIIDRIYRINWIDPATLSPEFAAFLQELCHRRNIPMPRFGMIDDGNPNAFTSGHIPGDARLVITRGVADMLDEQELRAVVAHEIGHITHYDFIVMSVAALVPMMLYIVYIWTRRVKSRRDGGIVLAVALGAYLAYIVTQYLVLFLSRVREYYADAHATESVENANAISTALIKIAYGMVRNAPAATGTNAPAFGKASLIGSLGISNFRASSQMALYATDASGQYSAAHMLNAMQWDLCNPWARWFEFHSTHPLVALRVRAAGESALRQGQQPLFPITGPSVNLWPAFLVDFTFAALPYLGLLVGLGYSLLKGDLTLGPILLLTGIGWLVRLGRTFAGKYQPAQIVSLLSELDVSHIHPIPVQLRGEVIGRGAPGLFWSKDLVLQDESGFITLVYRQPFGFVETIFGIFRANKMIGKRGDFYGWYRRGQVPYLELRKAQFDDGTKANCYMAGFLRVLAIALLLIGALLTLCGV